MQFRANQTYFSVVWQQLQRNTAARWSWWLLLALGVLAIMAPLVASSLPLVFWDGAQVLFPWFRGLFVAEEPVNYIFNMCLVAFGPWLVIVAGLYWRRRSRGSSRPGRWGQAALLLGVMTLALAAIFAVPRWRFEPRYGARLFAVEEFQSPQTKRGKYVFIPFGPTEQDLDCLFKPPLYRKPLDQRTKATDAWPHWFGTDNTGRDVVVQMLYGTRISITVGFLAVGLYVSIGTFVGALAGYLGGTVDLLLSRVIEVMSLFPAFFLILTLVALLGPSIYIVMFVIGITGWPSIARLIRAEVLKQRSLDYITAARMVGASHTRIVLRHLLPNSLGPALVAAPFGVGAPS